MRRLQATTIATLFVWTGATFGQGSELTLPSLPPALGAPVTPTEPLGGAKGEPTVPPNANAGKDEKKPAPAENTPITPFIVNTAIGNDQRGFVDPRFTIRRDFGDGPGFRDGFTYVEGFQPIWQTRGQSIVFANVRVVNFDNERLWEFNGGIGARQYFCDLNRILGGHVHYDGRTTLNQNYFNQVTFGVESLGERLDFRANFYFPVGAQRFQTAEALGNVRFSGFNILLDRTQVSEVALRGLDCEIGTPIPPFCRWDARAFIGYYHYSNTGLQAINGIRGRLEANITDRATLHLSVQNDAVSDTTVYGGFALHFGPGRKTRSGVGRGVVDRLGDRVVRDPNIVAGNAVKVGAEPALDVNTGLPLIIRHANSNAAPGGNGTFELPFKTLATLQNGSFPNEILYVHGGSNFTGAQFIQLQNGQRLLGENATHFFTSIQGTFLLPRATTNPNLPIIDHTVAGSNEVIRLANNTEVAGFDIRNATLDGIKNITPVSNVIVRDNIITNPKGDGIELDNATGNVVIQRNFISFTTNKGNEGIDIFLGGTSAGNYSILNNTVIKPDDSGIEVFLQDNAVFTGVVSGNRIDQAVFGKQTRSPEARDAILFQLRNSASARVSVLGNVINKSEGAGAGGSLTGSGIHMILINSANGDFQVARNVIDQTKANGIFAETSNTSKIRLQVFGNTTNRNIQMNRINTSSFFLEDTLPTNTLLGGAVINQPAANANFQIFPFGTFGFPPP